MRSLFLSLALIVLCVSPVSADLGTSKVADAYAETATSTQAVISKPSGTTQNDIMFAILQRGDVNNPTTVPSGWTAIGTNNATRFWGLYYKVAGSSEPTSYTWEWTANSRSRGVIVTYRGGFNTSSPIAASSNTPYTAADYLTQAASVTVSTSEQVLLMFSSVYQTVAVSYTKPTTQGNTWVEDYDAGGVNLWQGIFRNNWVGTGASGTASATLSPQPAQKHSFMVALAPYVAPTPTPSPTPTPTATPSATPVSTSSATLDQDTKDSIWFVAVLISFMSGVVLYTKLRGA